MALKMKMKSQISIIIPALNEGKNIHRLINAILKNLKNTNFEIIYVDDNSIDNSKNILLNLSKKFKFFKPILRKKKEISLNLVLME